MTDYQRYTQNYWDDSDDDERDKIRQEHKERLSLSVEEWNQWANNFSSWLEYKSETGFIDLSGSTFESFICSDKVFPCFINFHKCKFNGETNFFNTEFNDGADFCDTEFNGNTHFCHTKFRIEAFFIGATFSEGADFSGTIFSDRADFSDAIFNTYTSFSNATFSDWGDFLGATFNEGANFSVATFSDTAIFSNAKFSCTVNFSKVKFNAYITFSDATFSDQADFSNATFSDTAIFSNTTFSRAASFENTTFSRSANFREVTFKQDAIFQYAQLTALALDGATFNDPPDFLYSALATPAYLSNITINKLTKAIKSKEKRKEYVLRYRRLKEIAIQSHDHTRELKFFAAEVIADRRNHSLIYNIPGHIYQRCSNFGQSLWRPFFSLILLWLLCGSIYYVFSPVANNSNTVATTESAQTAITNSDTAIIPLTKPTQIAETNNNTEPCVANKLGYTVLHTLNNGIPLIGSFDTKRATIRECAIGSQPHIGLNLLIKIQQLASLIFIFLFGLALRNRFKIK